MPLDPHTSYPTPAQTPPSLYPRGGPNGNGTSGSDNQRSTHGESVEDVITRVANEFGVPPYIALAIARIESGLDPNKEGDFDETGTVATSHGLFQLHLGGELDELPGNNADRIREALDPETNARVAIKHIADVYHQHPDWTAGKIGAEAQRPLDKIDYANKVDASVAQNGGPGAPSQSTNSDTPAAPPAAAGGTGSGSGSTAPGAPGLPAPAPVTRDIHAPAGGILVHPTSGGYYLIYDIGGNGEPGGLFDPLHPPAGHVFVMYDYGETNPNVIGVPPPITVDSGYFDGLVHTPGNHLIQAGDVRTLAGIPQGKTYQDYAKDIINVAAGGSDWVNDPDILELYWKFVAGKIGQNELTIGIHRTAYFNGLSTRAQQFNDPATSQAEKDAQVSTEASNLVQKYFDATGEMLAVTDPKIQSYALKIASGQMTSAQVFETWIKAVALGKPTSPLAIQTQQTANTGVYDLSSAKGQIRAMALRWGIPYTDALGDQYAQKLVNHEMGPTDMENVFRTQAKTMYPWIDTNVDVQTQAEPWLTTYRRVMEKSAELDNPDIQKALTAGTPVYQFEQDLKKSPDWLQTKNAQQDMTQGFGAVARMMGFE